MRYMILFLSMGILAFSGGCSSMQTHVALDSSGDQIPAGALLETDIAGKTAEAARKGIVRVTCRPTSSGGTGFLHKSGVLITAAHVVTGCAPSDLILVTASGQEVGVVSVFADDDKDLAILRPTSPITGNALVIAPIFEPRPGRQVITWGYPGGYDGPFPLLSAGYFAGIQDFTAGQDRKIISRWVINAAFNGGNSGGPVFAGEEGQVIGVVSSKLAPLPESIAQILKVLSAQRAILQYERVNADGTKTSLSEGQIVAEVLKYLRSQVQLVIGYAVTTKDLKEFLTAQGLTP